MRVWGFTVLLFLSTPIFCQVPSQPNSHRLTFYLEKYLQTNSGTNVSGADFVSFIGQIENKRNTKRSDADFLRLVFTKIHSKFLKNYKEYSPFDELIKRGDYNCLTGTALYALALDYFGYEYKVIETNYHIFILTNTSEGNVLLEATDPQYGFIVNEKTIKDKINEYRQDKIAEASKNKSYYQFSFELYKEVNLDELTGLLYYNRAVAAFNDKSIDLSIELLQESASYYNSERIDEFSTIILQMLANSKLEATTKQAYLNKIKLLGKSAVL
jgi:hypothetical protein